MKNVSNAKLYFSYCQKVNMGFVMKQLITPLYKIIDGFYIIEIGI